MNNKPLIIDTDPWVDDALAIMYLLKYWIQPTAITTIFWNSDIENTTKNALKILSILWERIPVFKWENAPLKVEPTFAKSHWDWGLWWFNIELNQEIERKTAFEFLVSLLESNKEVTIICLWPTTNIAKLSILRPDLVKSIARLIILWWVLWENWNITQFAEFNVYNDPDALSMVLNLKIEKYLIPINVCRKVFFNSEDFNNIKNSKLSSSIKEITKQYIKYYTTNKEYWDFQWWVMYDLLATTFYTNPELFFVTSSSIEVSIKWKNIWETIEVNWINNCQIVTDVNVNELKKKFFGVMNF